MFSFLILNIFQILDDRKWFLKTNWLLNTVRPFFKKMSIGILN